MQSPIETEFANLTRRMREVHTAVHPGKNPVAQGLGTYEISHLEHVIGQYSLFPQSIVDFLYVARDTSRKAGWNEVATELTRNIGEELGTESDGVSHYEMLLHGIADQAGEASYKEFKTLEASPATSTFLARVKHAVGNTDVAYAIGATYALESSAVPELVIVRDILTRFLTLAANRPIEGTLKSFFDMHLGTWEPGHEQGLHASIPRYVSAQDLPSFHAGFEEVMDAMDAWWAGLNDEVRRLIS